MKFSKLLFGVFVLTGLMLQVSCKDKEEDKEEDKGTEALVNINSEDVSDPVQRMSQAPVLIEFIIAEDINSVREYLATHQEDIDLILNKKDILGKTPIDYAKETSNQELIELFRSVPASSTHGALKDEPKDELEDELEDEPKDELEDERSWWDRLFSLDWFSAAPQEESSTSN